MREPLLVDVEKLFNEDIIRAIVIRDLKSIYNFNMDYLKDTKRTTHRSSPCFPQTPLKTKHSWRL